MKMFSAARCETAFIVVIAIVVIVIVVGVDSTRPEPSAPPLTPAEHGRPHSLDAGAAPFVSNENFCLVPQFVFLQEV